MPNVSNDLSQKLYATMEKHKEVNYGSQTTHYVLGVHLIAVKKKKLSTVNLFNEMICKDLAEFVFLFLFPSEHRSRLP